MIDDPLALLAGLARQDRAMTTRSTDEKPTVAVPAEALPIGFLAVDRAGRVQVTNAVAERLLGYGPGELAGRRVYELIPPRMSVADAGPMERCCAWVLAVQAERTREMRALRSDGTEALVEVSVVDGGGDLPLHVLLVDLTERKESEAEIHHLGIHDELTGLANRRRFVDRVRDAVSVGRHDGTPCAIFLIDLDNFSLINESLGPRAGDDVLREVARRLRGCLPSGATVARFDGDEFALLVEGVRENRAAAVVTLIESAFSEPFRAAGHRLVITASIGGAVAGRDADDAETIIRHAHTAMYRAKNHGRASVEMFAPAMHAQPVRTFDLQERLRRALASFDELSIAYQPVVALGDGRITGFEALLRWRSGGEDISPAEFIPVAEQTGLIVPLGAWVLERALMQLANWQRLPGCSDLTMAVNLSPRQLSDDRLMTTVARALKRSGVDARSVVFEITETAAMSESEATVETLASLRRLGARVMLDDFGTGYSSLGRVVRLPIDGLKIDREFVQRIESDPRSQVIVEAVIGLGRGLETQVIAEGIETEAQRQRLADAGCRFGQGFHFGRPMSAEDAGRRAADHQR